MTCTPIRRGTYLILEMEGEVLINGKPFKIEGKEGKESIRSTISTNASNPSGLIEFYEMVTGLRHLRPYMKVEMQRIVLRRRENVEWGYLEGPIRFTLEVFLKAVWSADPTPIPSLKTSVADQVNAKR